MQEGEPHVFLFLRLIFGLPSNVWHRGMFKNLMACVLRRGVGVGRPTSDAGGWRDSARYTRRAGGWNKAV